MANKKQKQQKKEKYYWLTGRFGDRDVGPITLREFRKACKELEWAIPVLFEEIDGTLRMRVYTDGFESTYEGCPDFDYEMWLYKGANWETVFEPASDEEVRQWKKLERECRKEAKRRAAEVDRLMREREKQTQEKAKQTEEVTGA